jgi:PAS domain S-box-containing protein
MFVLLNRSYQDISKAIWQSLDFSRILFEGLAGEKVDSLPSLDTCPTTNYLKDMKSAARGDPVLESLISEAEFHHEAIHRKGDLIVAGFLEGVGTKIGSEEMTYIVREFFPLMGAYQEVLEKLGNYWSSKMLELWSQLQKVLLLLTIGVGSCALFGLGTLVAYRRRITETLAEPLERIFDVVSQAVPGQQVVNREWDAEQGMLQLEKLIRLATQVHFKEEEAINHIFTAWARRTVDFDQVDLLRDILAILFTKGIILTGAYYRFDEWSNQLKLETGVALPAETAQEIRLGHGLAGQCALEQKLLVGREKIDLYSGLGSPVAVRVLAVPLGLEKLLGVLLLAVPAELEEDLEHVADRFRRIGRQVSLIMEKHKRDQERKWLLEEVTRQADIAEKELANLQAVMASAPSGICTIDADGRVTSWSRGAEIITGYSTEEALGRTCGEVLKHTSLSGEPICGTPDCVLCRAFQGEIIAGMEAFLVAKGGRWIPIRVGAAPVRVANNPVREIVQVFDDLTQLKTQMKELERANQAKSEFLATMSHELRTPLNAVIGFAELLRQTPDIAREKVERYADNILRAGRHLLSLVNDILDLAKVESGRMEWENNHFNLVTLLQNAVLLLKERASEASLTVRVDLSPELPSVVYGDERKLKQIVFNLLGNAIKFTPSGRQVGLVAGFARDEFRLEVWDEGPGIPPEKMTIIFEPFVQGEPYLARSHQGTGLGLAIVKKFVELGGGRVEVANRSEGGAVFRVFLPVRKTDETVMLGVPGHSERERLSPAYPPDKPPDSLQVPAEQRGTCVVVEDDPAAAELLSGYYQKLGYTPVVVTNAEEFWRIMEREDPRFVSLDVLLPGTSGWEILSALRDNPQWRSLPVIIVSVLPESSKGFALGADEYLTKPVDNENLYLAIQRAIMRRRGEEERVLARAKRILIIDDEPPAVEVIANYLRGRGLEVAWAYSAEAGFRKAMSFQPDAIILDLLMPEASGLTFLKWRTEHPRLQQIPVVVVTSKQLGRVEREELASLNAAVYSKAELFEEEFWNHLKEMLSIYVP